MIEKLIDLCARNKFLVLLVTGFACVASWMAIQRAPLDAIPDLSDPQVIIYTEWMGRSPGLIEDQVTYPITTSLLSAPHVTDVRGFSMFGMSFVHVLFEEGTDIYWARSRVLEYLSSLRGKLPDGVEPQLGPDATGVGWVYQYALVDRSGKHDPASLRTFQDYTLRYALTAVPGVAEVASVGGYQKQYQITVDPNRLRAYGITLAEVGEAIRRSNGDVGGRILEMSGREYFVRGRGYLKSLSDLEKVTVRASSSGTPVLVRDIGTVAFGGDIRRGVAELDGEGEAVGAIVVMRQGENALAVIERVKERLEELKPSFPEGVELVVAYDRSELIGHAVETLKGTLLEEGLVVALVILLFLLHFRSALVPILVLPVSVALAFIPMRWLGISSNLMSLGGIAIAIGAMVDATIVLVENAHKKLEQAKPRTAAERVETIIAAAKEVGPAIFFSLLVVTVSFFPVFALEGQPGRLFKPLAFTKTFAMFFSAVLAVTLAPALMVLLIKGKIHPEEKHPISRFLIAIYKPFVFVALRNPKTTVAIGVAAVISTIPLIPRLGSEFMPTLDEGDVLFMPTTFPNVSIEEVKASLQQQDRILKSFPEVISVFGKAGRAESATDPAPLSMVETVARLKPRSEWRMVPREPWWSGWTPEVLAPVLRTVFPDQRQITTDELFALMNDALAMPGWTNALTMPIKTRIDMLATGVRTPVGVKIFGNDLAEIEQAGTALEQLLSTVPGTRSSFYERSLGGLYVDVVPDRDALARYGLTIADVNEVVELALGGEPVTTTIEGRSRFTVNLRYPRDLRDDPDRLREALVPVTRVEESEGEALPMQPAPALGAPAASRLVHVPLGQLADVKVVSGPPMIRNENGMLAGYLFVDVDAARTDLGGYVKRAKALVDEARADGRLLLPQGTILKWTGQYELMERMAEKMKVIVPLTLLLIVVLLYLHFRNVIETLIVLLSVPFAMVGSIWLLWLLDYRLSTAVYVGMIALVGLAAETGIVMIVYLDRAFERRKAAGKIRNFDDIVWAHLEGTVMRVRPKLMTVATTAVGLVPILWSTGAGADVMKRIAAPMVGGLVTSVFLTLEIIPVVYTWWRLWELKQEKKREAEEAMLEAG
ncbi:efflux RND transporter permease subunit [Vulgatibacter incomptus]|uniref:Cobalt-zinc-cadmium resistance protein CzcA n=1 Tax=Vulgatibacter incomptus TaxID=1391653 RepID=A0A0K1PD44_9BACT|nr:CusA/CzcA family heavy metal efflux RND transporter [Vulgatibacter incomptus]AKU91422.1 Cobalt-zinc-cadmium resistance protein CzcA [Vulgatibacter incomptus]